jgi:subtilase family serine protease
MSPRRITASATGVVLLVGLVIAGSAAGAIRGSRSGVADPSAMGTRTLRLSSPWLDLKGPIRPGPHPPSDASCRAKRGTPCYSPREIQHAYGVDRLLERGGDGAGQRIVLIDTFGSPTLAADLATFDAGYGLPAPPSLKVLAPLGTVPFDPSKIPDQLSWATETTLDVEWAHAMAPRASIVVLTSPVDETQGLQGLPEFNALLNYALDHHLGDVISQSWGATENGLFTPDGERLFRSFERSFARAAATGVTVLASTGDTGASNPIADETFSFYPFATVNFPASSPLVTGVGGTSLYADTAGDYQSETVWNTGGGATGGGISQKFAEPLYQRALPLSMQRRLGGNRGLPDVSWNADPNTPILIYQSFLGPRNAGYYAVGGTSEGSPQLGGLIADIDQLRASPIGFLNPYLYALGVSGMGFHGVTVGNNSYNRVTGYEAAPGWNPATGWGTPDIAQFFPDLGALTRGGASMTALLSRARSLTP